MSGKFIFILLAFLPGRAGAASCTGMMRPLVQMNVWRHYGRANFDSSHLVHSVRDEYAASYHTVHMGLAAGGARYYPVGRATIDNYGRTHSWLINPPKAEFTTETDGTNIYERLQYYSLRLMQKIRYLDSAGVEREVQRFTKIDHNLVTAFEATQSRSEKSLREEFGKIPESAREDTDANSWNTYQSYFDHSLVGQPFGEESAAPPPEPPVPDIWYENRAGVSLLIAGQDASQNYTLPHENEDLETPIDRSRLPFIWEVSRAGGGEAFEETLRPLAYTVLTELVLLGGRLEDAYVFGHSGDAAHLRLYRNKGMDLYSGYRGLPKQKLSMAPLAVFLQRFPAQEYSATLADVLEASENQLSAFTGVKLIMQARQFANSILSAQDGRTLELRDFSHLASLLMEAELQGAPLSAAQRAQVLVALAEVAPRVAQRDSIGDRAHASASPYHAPVHGIWTDDDRADRNRLQRLRVFLYENNAIEVDGRDGRPMMPALVEAYLFTRERAQKAGLAAEVLKDVRFCFVSEHTPGTAGVAHWFIRRDEWVTFQTGGFNFGRQVVVKPISLNAVCFTAAQIAAAIPAGVTISNFAPGRAQTERFLGDPQLYGP